MGVYMMQGNINEYEYKVYNISTVQVKTKKF